MALSPATVAKVLSTAFLLLFENSLTKGDYESYHVQGASGALNVDRTVVLRVRRQGQSSAVTPGQSRVDAAGSAVTSTNERSAGRLSRAPTRQLTLVNGTEPASSTVPSSSRTAAKINLNTVPATPFIPQGDACAPPNRCIVEQDDNLYYRVQYVKHGADYWIDPYTLGVPVNIHETLADAHRLAAQVRLSFEFFYYGHVLNSIIVTTGGFLYMNDFSHSFLTATQYVAPLMANFDTSKGSNVSHVMIVDNGTVCIIQWNNVIITDHVAYGAYTFQVQLYKSSGKIVFAYLEVPQPLHTISTNAHPVRVGISDAFYWDTDFSRTIYEYDQLRLDMNKIVSHSAVVLHHKKSCQFLNSCRDCVTEHLPHFNCSWCERLGRCSSLVDRGRQQWYHAGCKLDRTGSTVESCNASLSDGEPNSAAFSSADTRTQLLTSESTIASNGSRLYSPAERMGRSMLGGLVAVLSTLALVSSCACFVWFCYAYRYPGSRAGQWLIENRPSRLVRKLRQWRNSRGSDNESCTIEIQPLPSETSVVFA